MTKKQTPPSQVDVTQSVYSRKSQAVRVRQQNHEEIVYTLVVIPPDGGWGWVVVVASFLVNFILDGTIYSFGLFLEEMGKDMGTLPTRVAYASSIMIGVNLLSAPIICGLTNRYGFRKIGFIGGIYVTVVLISSSFAKDLSTFVLVFGVLGGVGCAMIYLPAIVIVGFYFERWRALAAAIAVCGSSCGIIFFPMVLMGPLSHYDWRCKFRFMGCLFLFTSLFSLTYRPLPSVTMISDGPDLEDDSILSVYLDGDHGTAMSQMYSNYHNLMYPTSAGIQELKPQKTGENAIKKNVSSSSTLVGESAPGVPGGSSTMVSRMSTVYEEEFEKRDNRIWNAIRRCFTCCSCSSCRRFKTVNDTVSRPMYRDDIFFTGSVYTLPEYPKKPPSIKGVVSKKSTIDYHRSVTRVATQRDLEEEDRTFVCCPEALKRTLVTMLDFSLLKSPSFIILVVSGFFVSLGMYVPFVYIMQKALQKGIDAKTASMMVTGLGIANLGGRMLCGLIALMPNVNAVAITYIGLFMAGIPSIAFAFATDLWMYYLFIGLYGSSIAAVPTMKTILLVDLLGLDKLTNSFGITLMFQGLSSFIGIPLAGFFIECTRSYDFSFIYCGCTSIISAILLVPIKRIKRWEMSKQTNK